MVDASKIHVFDTKMIAFPQGIMAIEAAKLADEGKSGAEIIAHLESLRNKVQFIAAIDDMTNLKKGGRVSAIQAGLGSMLQVKPVLNIIDGSLAPLAKVRTFKKALDFLVESAVEAGLNPEIDEVGVVHMDNLAAAEMVRDKVIAAYSGMNVVILPLSLTVSVHAGPGAIGIGWIKR